MTNEERMKKRITARKYMGDDAYSWAVFSDGTPVFTGLGKSQVSFYKQLALEILQKKEPWNV